MTQDETDSLRRLLGSAGAVVEECVAEIAGTDDLETRVRGAVTMARCLQLLLPALADLPPSLDTLREQRDHARAVAVWEYYGRPCEEPALAEGHDDGWTHRAGDHTGADLRWMPAAALREH